MNTDRHNETRKRRRRFPDLEFIQRAIQLAAEHMRAKDGGPFGAVVARKTKSSPQAGTR